VKRVYLCAALFAALVIFSALNSRYVKRVIDEIGEVVGFVEESSVAGDFDEAVRYSEEAIAKWDAFRDKIWLLSNKQFAAEITASLARINALASSGNDEVLTECAAARAYMDHLAADNSIKLDPQ